jgi:hypothetical protein
MNPVAAPIPLGSEISRRVGGAYFQDCYVVPLQENRYSALELYLGVISQTPTWVNRLMALRNTTVGLVGLKNLGHLGAVDQSKPSGAYRVGDRVGIFSVLYLTGEEVILGDSDKHLNAQVSVYKSVNEGRASLAVSTVVHVNNTLGRVYMLFVGPVHKLIVPAMLRRAAVQHVA